MFDEKGTFTLPPNCETRNYMVHLGHRHARDCINLQNNITKTLKFWNDNKANFPDDLHIETWKQLSQWDFKCLLPVEMEGMEVKVKMIQSIHTFKRDRTSQIIKCNPCSTRLCPYPSLIQKMKMYLELEGKFCLKPRPQPQTQLEKIQLCPTQPQPSTSAPPQSTNPMTGKAPGPKNDKRRKTMLTKRRYKVGYLSSLYQQHPPVNSTAPTPL